MLQIPLFRRVRPWPIMAVVVAAASAVSIGCSSRVQSEPAPPTGGASAAPVTTTKTTMPYAEARPILDAFRDSLPPELQSKSPRALEAAWPEWAHEHDAAVRARLARGDEDSIVNFWMFGTTFTSRPRATAQDLAAHGGRAAAADVLLGRLDDLVAAIASPGSNERLQFARQVLARQGINPSTPAGQEQTRAYLIGLHERVIGDNDRYRRAAQAAGGQSEPARLAAFATVFSDRGLSSDSSLPIDFALDVALTTAKTIGRLGAASVHRVGIIGPGLDFSDKADGYDFYPPQTIQPFALIDSLVRLGLTATPADLRVTTFDLSPRVNQHLDAARQRADHGDAYVLQLPIARNDPSHDWMPEFVQYWQRCGNAIGEPVAPLAPPAGATQIDVRAIRVPAPIVVTIDARDLNVVLERPASLADAERFDLIVATNVLVYYDPFEQALALQNISRMLRPGGFLLTNYAVTRPAPLEAATGPITTTYWDRQRNFDTLFWYQRK